MNHSYIISKKSKFVNSDLVDIALMDLLGCLVTSHWWDGFLITCLPTSHLEQGQQYFKSHTRLSYIKTTQTVDEYHMFTKQYWRQKDLDKQFLKLSS